MHAQEAYDFFKEHVPLAIHKEIENVVENLWKEVNLIPAEDLHNEVQDWVVVPGNTVG